MTKLLRAGAISGAAGGAALAAVLLLFAETPIGAAVALEEGPAHEEVFSRSTQQAGGALGALLFGVAVGLVFAVVFATVRHRLRGTDGARSLALAAAAFVAVGLVPAVLYPVSPPGASGDTSVGLRTWAYLTALGWSVFALVASVKVARRLVERGLAPQPAALLAVLLHLGLVLVAALVLPDRTLVGDLPAELVWELRLSSLLGSAALWGTIGLAFPWAGAAALRTAPTAEVGSRA